MSERSETWVQPLKKTTLLPKGRFLVSVIYICFIGTHSQYDAIDAETI
jgi:mRNA-degrading endonuclease HigB of HigAB toxin-antitoxin module